MTKDEVVEPETHAASVIIEISEFCESFNCLPDEALRQPYKLMKRITMYRRHKAKFEHEKHEQDARQRRTNRASTAKGARSVRRPRRR